ncbi:MAG: hypothetical protein IPM24_23580 [Bryobacterales bacterium]|nr:hypothetical protein [Bryobacterales bacterium]
MRPEARYYAGMAAGIWDLLRQPVVTNPRELLRERVAGRGETFLKCLQDAIFANPEHPYSRMFQMAGCQWDDVASLVRRDGLEAALCRLRAAGIYLTHDEFKGKQPILRSGQAIPAHTADFANPLVRGWLRAASGGSTGKPVPVSLPTEHLWYREAYTALRMEEFGLRERVHVELKSILPSMGGIGPCLHASRLGHPVAKWFSVTGTLASAGHYRAATAALVTLARLRGARVPYPEALPYNDFSPVARFIEEQKRLGRRCSLRGLASPVARAAAASFDISGTLCFAGGEAVSDAKRATVQAAGAALFATYMISEIGLVGEGCRDMGRENSVHLLEDSVAVITWKRPAPFADGEVDSLHFTTIQPHSPHILINAEMDDTATVSRAPCDCVYSRTGYRTRLSAIASFGKLTGQGLSLFGTDLVQLLEQDLPARLGGAAGDYQLAEVERRGQTQVRLCVSPRTGLRDAQLVRQVFLELVRGCYGGVMAQRLLTNSDGLEIAFAEPFVGPTGKVPALRPLTVQEKQ